MEKRKIITWLKDRKWDVLLGVIIILMLIPNVRKPVLAFAHHLLAGSPSVIANNQQEKVSFSGWRLVDMKGNAVFPSTTNGKVKIINFWATWCPSCVAEFPEFQKLYDAYKDKVDFYFISNENPKVIHRFLSKHHYQLPIYHAVQFLPAQLQSRQIPATYVVSKSGLLKVKAIGTKDWYSKDFRKRLDGWINNLNVSK